MRYKQTLLINVDSDGASLVYTNNFDPNSVRTLIHSSLSIHSLLERESPKHNVIERDRILVPPNWDSWGKIRILQEGFDLEAVSNAWSIEIQSRPEELSSPESQTSEREKENSETQDSTSSSAVAIFESALPNPANDRDSYKTLNDAEAEVTAPDTQTFLAQQAMILNQIRTEDDKGDRRARKGAPAPTGGAQGHLDDGGAANAPMAEHIGPYQINVGGIQVDAEEVTRRMQEAGRKRGNESPRKEGGLNSSGRQTPDGGKSTNEAYKDFFANLMKKGKGGTGDMSPRGSPSRAS